MANTVISEISLPASYGSYDLLSESYHAGRVRMPTPDKSTIVSVAGSDTRRRLGRRQRLLRDATSLGRQQEVSDLSYTLASKLGITELRSRLDHEATFYSSLSTNRMRRQPTALSSSSSTVSMFGLERGNTCFPTRRSNSRLSTTATDKYTLPKIVDLSLTYRKGVMRHDTTSRRNLLSRQRINGPIQLDLYTQQPTQLKSTSVPALSDQTDDYFKAQRITPKQPRFKTRSLFKNSADFKPK